MSIAHIILATLVGTTLMTLFSYLLSERKNKQFKEPVILNKLLGRLPALHIRNVSTDSWGWGLHYGIGFIFALLFVWVWKVTEIPPTIWSGALFGIPAGIIGITGWISLFALHPDPPRIDFKNFYLQLMVAHIIFGAGAALGMQLADRLL